VIALTLATVVAACGGGGSSAPPPTIDSTTKDQLTVDAAVLQMSDLPGTWSTNRPASTASDELPSRDDVLTIADTCFPTPDGITATTAREFLSGPTLGHVLVRGVVEAHQDASTLTGKLPAFTADATKACVQQEIQKIFPGAMVTDISVVPSTVAGAGDERGGFLITVRLASGAEFAIGEDIVFARVGRFRAACTVVNFDTTPDHALCTEGLKAMGRRLEE
jgi:hypothetical protein